ncbi:alpha-2-macroglobulin-like protein 1 [Xenopus tropicalis]|uniref:Alpha-2-macroglobulin-like protein 1 n=1 Tax=Xenopus tropicalis TaxID=8364 RepID=A0A8J1JXK5_XENTR|nr:alpha-2-macroglobulin-like protein 1 [Xenopus tropicalis]|eukprot:XP_012810391.1 PREDICTED: alpha-2-macroglobulin-like protein 1 [Xenopus tropicalis]
MPDKVTPNDDSFHLEVCGSYTYGKPVQGVMKIALYPVDIPWWMVYYDRVDPEMTEELGTAQGVHTDDCGCLIREIDLRPFNVSSNNGSCIIDRRQDWF